MKLCRIIFFMALVGSLHGPILAQEPWRKSPSGVSLGQPSATVLETAESIRFISSAPSKASAAYPLPTVVRGARPIVDDEPRNLLAPKDLAPARERRFAPSPFSFLPEPSGDAAQMLRPAQQEVGPKLEAGPKQETGPKQVTAPKLENPVKPENGVKKMPTEKEAKTFPVPLRNYYMPPDAPSACSNDEGIISESDARAFLGLGVDPQFYVRAEYLQWWTRGFRVPPLVTTASVNDPADTRGALGFGTTQLLFGDTTVLQGTRPGARFTLGWNCDPCGIFGIEANFFFLGRKSDSVAFDSSNFPVIGRPFFLLNTGEQSRELTTTPEFSSGDIRVDMSTNLFGAEINKRVLLWCGCDYKLTGLVGVRYLDLRDRLKIEERTLFTADVPAVNPAAPPLFSVGDRSFVFDRFETHNRFYGGQVGLEYEKRNDRWTIEGRVKVGFGATHQVIDIDGGQQFVRRNGTVQNFSGGLLAVDSNIGHHTQTKFGFVPEVGFKVGYDLNSYVRVFAGYDFLYWSSVVRPGDQIDLTLDANRIPNAGGPFPPVNQVRPRVPFQTSNYWAHGFSGGLELRY